VLYKKIATFALPGITVGIKDLLTEFVFSAAKLQRLPPSSGFARFCAATGKS